MEQVLDSIRNDLRARRLDVSVTAAVEHDVGEEGDNDDHEDEGQEGDDTEDDADPSLDESNINMPRVAIWFRNAAVLRNLWGDASQTQRVTVKQHTKKEEAGDSESDDKIGDDEPTQNRVKRLKEITKFISLNIVAVVYGGLCGSAWTASIIQIFPVLFASFTPFSESSMKFIFTLATLSLPFY